MISGDVCVPISQFGEMVEFVHDVAERAGLPHLCLWPRRRRQPAHRDRSPTARMRTSLRGACRPPDEIVEHALALGGTIAGEHGVGLGKRQFMVKEHGASLE